MAETSVLRSSASPQNASPLSATPQAKMSGPHPLVQVQMGSGGKPIIGGANQGPARSVVILPPKGARALAPQLAQQVAPAAPVSPITSDQLLLCRHLVDKHFAELTASSPENTGAIDLAVSTLDAIDGALAAANAARAQPAKPRPPAVVVTNPRSSATAPGATAPRRVMREPAPAQVIDAPASDASAED